MLLPPKSLFDYDQGGEDITEQLCHCPSAKILTHSLLNLHRRIKHELFLATVASGLCCSRHFRHCAFLIGVVWRAHIQIKRNFLIIFLQKIVYYLPRVTLCLKTGNNRHDRAGALLQIQLNHSQLKNKQSSENNTTVFCKYSPTTKSNIRILSYIVTQSFWNST